MPSFETLFVVGAGVAAAALALVVVAVLRPRRPPRAALELAAGDFAAARRAAAAAGETSRAARLAGAVAAKHELDFAGAAAALDILLAEEPDDGEVWLERGLVAAYAGADEAAAAAFRRAAELRADLGESITLHRAWLRARRGDRDGARRLFEEIEAPLETKLRLDLGPRDPLFAEWFLHAAVLWHLAGDQARATWAWEEGVRAAPRSRLREVVYSHPTGATARSGPGGGSPA